MVFQSVNTQYMIAIFITTMFAVFSIGFTLGGYNAAGIVAEIKMSWSHSYTILITSSGVLGMMIGSLTADRFIVYGRYRAAFIANMIIIVSTLPQMWLSVLPLCIGRFMLGFGSGLFTVIAGIYMAETVPADKLSLYGTSINTGIVVGLLVTNLV